MTQNLKIEVLTGDISIDGMVVTNLVTKEELSTAIVKKADLGTDGKIPTSQLPAEIVNTAGIVDEVKLQLETSIKDAVDESNAYAESYTDNALVSKADLESGKVPLEQLPAIDQYPQFGTALGNLSTSILTSVKQRTDQLEKTKADLGEDGKVLREQIPSYEKISGLPEQLELMSTQTAAVSGELDEHKLQTADQIDTLKENIEANVQQLTDRQSHLMRTYATKELGVDAKVGVKPGEYFNVRSANEGEMLVEYQNKGGSAVATGKSYLSALGVEQQEKLASTIKDVSGKDQQQLNDIYSSQLLTTAQFKIIIPEVDDTGRLQRAFDASFEKKQKLYMVGDFNCSDTLYSRHDFDGSSSKITYPKDYSNDMLVFAAEKTLGTVRNSGKTVYFPSIYTTKTSGINNWASNVGSCAIKIVNPQECKFSFGETNSSELGVYVLAYNTDANYNTYDFGRHVYHKRPMTFHIQGDISVASMNQNTLNGGRFAVNNGTSRIIGIYLMHFLITGSTSSSCNNNLINNPSVEGGSDECAILFENAGTGSSLISYNTVNAPRLESGNVADKKILFKGNLVRWNRVMYGYGVDYNTIVNESGANSNSISTSIGALNLGGSLQNTAALNLQNSSGVNSPVLAVYGPTVGSSQFTNAPVNANAYSTSAAFITRSTQTVDRFKLTYASGKMEWSSGAFDTNLYRAGAGRLKTDGSIECVGGFGLFGSTPPIAQRTITGKKSPTTIAEQNAVLDSIVATLVAYGLVSDGRTT